MLLRTAQATKMFFCAQSNKMLAFLLFQFYDTAKTAKKKAFTQAKSELEVKQFYKRGCHN